MDDDRSAASARPTTLADVARQAGVSVATASKALNGRSDVGAATRARVETVAAELAFRPNVVARSLVSGRTGSVGLLTSDGEGRFAVPVMVGAEDALVGSETVAIMSNTRGRADLEERHLRALLDRRVDGLVVVGHATEARPPLMPAPAVRTVYAYAPSSSEHDTSFVPDHYGAGQMATNHLISLGRTRIAHVGGPLDGVGSVASRLRAAGTHAALNAAGVQAVAGESLHGDWLEQWGWEATARLLDAPEAIDGLVCANDQLARGAIDLLSTRGVRVPHDVAVIGFDDWLQFTALGRLPQTSVDMQLALLGRSAAQAVLSEQPLQPGVQTVAGRLIIRASTGG